MMSGAPSIFSSLLWFVVIVAAIPALLWLVKRSRVAGPAEPGLLRTVATLALAPGQRVAVVEVGTADARRWLVLGITAQSIQTLHEMAPAAGAPAEAAAPFAQLLDRLATPRD